jgi:hypothetical protein
MACFIGTLTRVDTRPHLSAVTVTSPKLPPLRGTSPCLLQEHQAERKRTSRLNQAACIWDGTGQAAHSSLRSREETPGFIHNPRVFSFELVLPRRAAQAAKGERLKVQKKGEKQRPRT